MKKSYFTLCCLFVTILMLISTYTSHAQDVQTIQIAPSVTQSRPISSAMPSQTGQMIPSPLPADSINNIEEMSQKQSDQIPSAASTQIEIAEKASEFEQFISGKVPGAISTDISQFGYDLFGAPASSFAPSANVPVGPGYVIGPGDEIRVTVWGKVEGKWNVTVDRDGTITLPKIGVIGVTGLSFSELKTLLENEFSKYYTGFEMNVSMGALRSIRIYVVGNAVRPGAYTISALSTLVSALFEIGGPSKTGTMRNIQLKRNGQVAASFDMYDFLLKGDKTKDVRLMPEDVIFIPPVGPMIGIAGNVKRPAIYELTNENRLLDLINLADGLSSTAFKGRVQVHRIEDHQFRTLFEGDLLDLEFNKDKNFVVKDGDLIKVFAIIDTKNTINLTGAVVSEGDYAITPGVTRISDVIAKAGGMLYYASDKAELSRVKVTQDGPKTEQLNIDIAKAMSGDTEQNIPLEINDHLIIRTVPGWKLYKTVSISGEVNYPGSYTIKSGETLSSLIERAGGYTDKAYLRGAVFTRQSVRDLQQQNLIAMSLRLEQELLIEGSVQVSTAVSKEEIESKKIELEQKKKFVDSLKSLKATGRMSLQLAHLRLLKGSEYDIELEEGDQLYIPLKNNVVNVVGAVMSGSSFVYSEQFKYKDYINIAGGFSRYADEDNVYVMKADGTAKKLNSGFMDWDSSRSRWEVSAFGEDIREIEPGDSIIVPEELSRIAWMREVKDMTQILYQIAVTAGVLIVAF